MADADDDDEFPDWLRGSGDASILRRSRNDIDRTGVMREPAGIAVIVAHTPRWPPALSGASFTDTALSASRLILLAPYGGDMFDVLPSMYVDCD